MYSNINICQSLLSVQKTNKWIILNFLIRRELWDLICGIENSNFFDFQFMCFSKVAAGQAMVESNDQILKVEGRDAGLGLVARRVATALTKELKESSIELEANDYVPYVPKLYGKDGRQIQMVNGTIEDTVRVDGVATITGVECHIHPLEDCEKNRVQVEIVGSPEDISKCKSCLISNEILTAHDIKTEVTALFKTDKPSKNEVEELSVESCVYNMEHVINKRACIAHGLIGKIDSLKFELFAAKFGHIESVQQASPSSEWNGNSYNSFLVTYKDEIGAIKALNARHVYFNDTQFKFLPYRHGDLESERQSRFVILQNLPEISELQLKMRFENEGIVASRLDVQNKSIGYLLLSQKQNAQRILKNGKLDYYPGAADRHVVKTLDISYLTRVLNEISRRRIFRELEIGHIKVTDKEELERCKNLKWSIPLMSPSGVDRKRKLPLSVIPNEHGKEYRRFDDFKRKPKNEPMTNLLENIMTGLDKETDLKVVSNREASLDAFKKGDLYSYWVTHCYEKDVFTLPEATARYPREADFKRKRFEWQNAISDWVTNHRNQSIGAR